MKRLGAVAGVLAVLVLAFASYEGISRPWIQTGAPAATKPHAPFREMTLSIRPYAKRRARSWPMMGAASAP